MTQEEIYFAIQHSTRMESKAIQQLFKSYYSSAKYVVLRHTGLCVEDAENIFQDAIICVVYKIKDGSFILQSEESVKRFLLKFVKNKSLSLARQKSKFIYSVPDNLFSEKEQTPPIQEEKLIEKIFDVAAKSRNGKEIITRRFLKGQGFPEIENALTYSKNVAKNQLYRVFESIRKEVKFDDYRIK